MKDLLADLREAIDGAFEHCDLGEPKVFRIFRDVRFSKDKSPYKTHIAGCIPTRRSAKVQTSPVALYAHFGTENVLASGLYTMEPPAVARYRAAVADDARGKEVTKILAKLEKRGYSMDSMHDGDVLMRVPRGFDREHPRSELLKRKGLGACRSPRYPKGCWRRRSSFRSSSRMRRRSRRWWSGSCWRRRERVLTPAGARPPSVAGAEPARPSAGFLTPSRPESLGRYVTLGPSTGHI